MHHDFLARVWRPIAAAVAALTVVTTVGFLIVANPAWSAAELRLVAAVHGGEDTFLDVIALTINTGLGPNGAPFIVLLGLAWTLLLTHSWRRTLTAALVLGIPWICAELLKGVVQRPRPDATQLTPLMIADPATYSYPSGHTAFAAALSCAVILVLATGTARTISIIVGAALVLVTAWSRVYLGVHYPTDVVASIVLVPFLAVATQRVVGRWLGSAAPTVHDPAPQPPLTAGS